MLALRAHDLVDLELHQFVHDAEPDSDAQREQALLRRSDELAERLLDLRWERTLRRLQGRDDLGGGYLLHGGSSCPLGLGLRPERSTVERTGREDRRSKFYESPDNLSGYAFRMSPRAPAPPALFELESEVMEEVWRQGRTNVRAVMEALNKKRRKDRAYTTYMTIMARLARKGLLHREREGRTDMYWPKLTREQFL